MERVPAVLSFPIHGVTVSPEGFRVILTSPARDRAAPLVISAADTDRVQSPEVLTIMQLMSGIDMATPVFPIDAVASAFGSPDAALAEVRVAPSSPTAIIEDQATDSVEKVGAGDEYLQGSGGGLASNRAAARRALKAPKMLGALRTLLPGQPVDAADVIGLMRVHADDDGEVSREGFSAIVAALREKLQSRSSFDTERMKATWTLVSKTGEVVEVAPFVGFACVARYRCPLAVQSDLFEEGNGISLGAGELEQHYPRMRTVEMLRDEAKDRSAWVIEQWLDSRGDGGFA